MIFLVDEDLPFSDKPGNPHFDDFEIKEKMRFFLAEAIFTYLGYYFTHSLPFSYVLTIHTIVTPPKNILRHYVGYMGSSEKYVTHKATFSKQTVTQNVTLF